MSKLGSVIALKYETFDRIVRDKRVRGLPVRVAWRIIDRMNANLTSWPSHALLARELDCSERAVYRAVALLCRLGWLDKVEGGGRGRSNRYALITDTVTGGSPFTAPGAKTVTQMTKNGDTDGQKRMTPASPESLKEPIKESIEGCAASPPEGGGAPSRKKRGLQGRLSVKAPPLVPRLRGPDIDAIVERMKAEDASP